MNYKIRPLFDRVLIELVENNEEVTIGGIIIPDAAKEKPRLGKVLAVGMGKFSAEGKVIPMQVKTGDCVFFGKYSGTEAGKDQLIIREDEILGIVE
ncbi:MAG: co-chaperone GroES [Candidatus Babeliaceae bacterium]|jgi:chaperonin GroES